MGLGSIFSFIGASKSVDIPNIFPFPVLEKDFVTKDVTNIYSRVLTDVVERTDGLTDEQQSLLWDNCIANENSDGLITLLSKAMAEKKELYLVYRKDLKLIRKANAEETRQIREDYQARGKSEKGVFITFQNYERTDFLKIYSSLEYYTISALYKKLNLSKAIQIKANDLRASVGLADKAQAEEQAKAIAEALGEGRDVLLDAKDILEMLQVDMSPTKTSMEFIDEKRSFYLGMPAAWVMSARNKTVLSDSGKGDMRDVERGLRVYYFSIIKPTLFSLLSQTTSFKSDDTDQIEAGLNTLKAMEVTSEEFLSAKNKQLIVNKAFGLPPTEKGDPVKEPETPPTNGVNPPREPIPPRQ